MSYYYTNIQTKGSQILLRGVRDGTRFKVSRRDFSPELFIPTRDKQSEYTGIYGQPMERVEFRNMWEGRQYIRQYKDVENFSIHGNDNFITQFAGKEHPSNITFDMKHICVATIDIEVGSENGFPSPEIAKEEVISIAIHDTLSDKTHVFACGEFDNQDDTVVYHRCDDEKDLLSRYMRHWSKLSPDIVTGWYIRGFDIPYLIRRLDRVFGEDAHRHMSPWKFVREKNVIINNESGTSHEISGVALLDYIDLYKKYSTPVQGRKPSYALDFIAHAEGVGQKLDYSEHESLHRLYKEDYDKFIRYNVQDVTLVRKLDEKLGYINLQVTMAYQAKINYEDVYSPKKLWDAIIYNYLRPKNVIIPPEPKNPDGVGIKGGYVKPTINGMHKWVVSFDVTSLYPSIISSLNLSVETIHEKHLTVHAEPTLMLANGVDTDTAKTLNATFAANGMMYDKSRRGYLPALIDELFDRRAEIKRDIKSGKFSAEEVIRMKGDEQGIKLAMNSLYGLLLMKYFRYYNPDNGSAVTQSGQFIIQKTYQELNKYLNKVVGTEDHDFVIAGDTDSGIFCLDPVVKKFFGDKDVDEDKIVHFLDELCRRKLEPKIVEIFDDVADTMNFYKNRLSMKRECICNKAVWTGKKRYIMSVMDDEGKRNDPPELKIKGVEIVRSSTPPICVDWMKEAVDIIMISDTKREVSKFISQKKKEFMKLPAEEVSKPSTANNLTKYSDHVNIYGFKCPAHVKGALLYNHYIRSMGLEKQYRIINEGDKIKFTYLREPNPIRDSVIAFPTSLPDELGLAEFIDYETQFEKNFLKPLNSLLTEIGWEYTTTKSIRGLFNQ